MNSNLPGDNNEGLSIEGSDNADGRTESEASEIYSGSKNIVPEHRGEGNLRDKFMALRALVPNSSKMDGTSIVADAISYVQSLQEQTREVEFEISSLESKRSESSSTTVEPTGYQKNTSKQCYKILDLNVTRVEGKTFMIRICCRNESEQVIVHLNRALESLQLMVINASISTSDSCILHTVFAEVKEWEAMQENEIKQIILETALKYGFQ